jgi:hypothetical protein
VRRSYLWRVAKGAYGCTPEWPSWQPTSHPGAPASNSERLDLVESMNSTERMRSLKVGSVYGAAIGLRWLVNLSRRARELKRLLAGGQCPRQPEPLK